MTASLTNDSLGLGGFGANAINGGFGVGAAAPAGGRGGRGGGLAAPALAAGRRFRRRWRRWRLAAVAVAVAAVAADAAAEAAAAGGARRTRGPSTASSPALATGGAIHSPADRIGGADRERTRAQRRALSRSTGKAAQKPYSANNRLNANIGGPLVHPQDCELAARRNSPFRFRLR